MRVDAIQPVLMERLAVIGRDAPLVEVARSLATVGHDLLVVRDSAGFALGVITRSDVVRHLSTGGSRSEAAEALMTASIVACAPADDLTAVWRDMHGRGLNNIPVLNARKLPTGILCARDALAALLSAEIDQESILVDYISGVGYH